MNNQIWIHLDTSVILPTSPGLAAHHPALELPQDLRWTLDGQLWRVLVSLL